MILSYWVRLACLGLFSAGIIQVACDLLLRLVASLGERKIAQRSARFQERFFFAVPVASHVAALVFTVLVVAPLYLRGESNVLQERVGMVCLAVASLVAARYGYGLLRAARILIEIQQANRDDGRSAVLGGGVQVQLSAVAYPPLAVMGLFSPRIVLSQHLLDNPAFSPQLLDLALAHEKAHVCQLDNLKYFVLAALALTGRRANGPLRRWRSAAEYAADDEAVCGSSKRAILLAEALLVAAHAVTTYRTSELSLGLLPHEERLDMRINRLLREEISMPAMVPTVTPVWRRITGAAILLPASMFVLVYLFARPLHKVAEYVLHLG